MINLPHGCSRSKLCVTPSNWESCKSIQARKKWYIHYRFYDPAYREVPKYRTGKLVILKGMNRFKTIAERRAATRKLIENEEKLLAQGYNPITGDIKPDDTESAIISSYMSFIDAMWEAVGFLDLNKSTMSNIKGRTLTSSQKTVSI